MTLWLAAEEAWIAALGRLMPLFLLLDTELRVVAAGPTLAKIAGPGLLGRPLDESFELVQPLPPVDAAALLAAPVLRLRLRGAAGTSFKGVAVRGPPPGGTLVNLSFSYGLREAIADHALSATDFAVTDLAFELLFLAEANAAVMAEARKSSERLRGARARALEQALTDPLTGLRNRRGLDRTLQRLAAAGTPFGLVHVDLDHFKRINDTLGHAAGDRVLTEVAARLRRAVRDDDSVARLGGDEFVVLLPGLRDRSAVEAVAQRLLADLARPLEPPLPGAPGISASLGVVLWSGVGPIEAEALLSAADRALYASKGAGRGRVTFHPDPPAAA
jgi:diguanylate cyclase (GGDEF)-like protein